MKNLKHKVIRGGFAKVCSQGATFLARMGSLMILARLLDPKDFGLVGMVTAITGVFSGFRDFGLSAAAVQRQNVSEEQASTLFWINISFGAVLALLVIAISPLIASFYREPRLLWVTIILATGFLFNAAGVQHSAILERQMRFTSLSVIDVVSLLTSIAVGIAMALRGFGYWSLVASATVTPFMYTVCAWVITGWVPGKPRKGTGARSMMRFGGTLTLNGLVMYVATNFEKILLGRFWGAEAIGIYGRAYQLVSIPNDNLNSSVGGVAFATLSRLQDDPKRFRSYFLKGYALVLSLTVPITIACALFPSDIIAVFLGAKWKSAAPVFGFLAPITLAFAMINPLGWLLMSLGYVGRGLKMALFLAPVMIGAYLVGLPRGPKGVAIAYSAMMTAAVLPMVVVATRGTVVSVRDILSTISRPLASGLVAAGVAFAFTSLYSHALSPLARLAMGLTLVLGIYLVMLLLVMGQRLFYWDLVRGFRRSRTVEEQVLVV